MVVDHEHTNKFCLRDFSCIEVYETGNSTRV
jgi:hypothetical protein